MSFTYYIFNVLATKDISRENKMLINTNEMKNIIVLHSWYSTSLSTISLLYKYFNKS